MRKIILLTCWLILAATSLQGQSSDRARESLFASLNALVHGYSDASVDDQLKALLNYQEKLGANYSGHDSTYAHLLFKISWLYQQKQEYQLAIQYIQQAIAVANNSRNKSFVNRGHLVTYYADLSYFYGNLNFSSRELKAADTSIEIAQQLKQVDTGYLYALFVKAKYYFDIGDFARAAELNVLGSAEVKRLAVDDYQYKALFRHNEINARMALKEYALAEKLMNDMEADTAHMKAYTGTVYMQRGEMEAIRGNYTKSLDYYNRAAAFSKKNKKTINCLQAYENIGYFIYYKYAPDHAKALNYYRKAFQYRNRAAKPSSADAIELLNLATNMANSFTRLNQFDSAFYYYQYAFDQLEKGIDESRMAAYSLDSLVSLGRLFYVTALLIDKGDAWLLQYKRNKTSASLSQALRIYKAADQLLDRIKAEQVELASQLEWRKEARRLYERAVEAAWLTNNVPDAFYFFEKSRAVLLSDQLNKLHSLNTAALVKQAQLKKSINQLKLSLNNTSLSAADRVDLERKYIAQKQQLDQLGESFKTHNPIYYQGFFDTSFITLPDVQHKILMNHNLLLELFESDSAIYALYITRTGAQLEKINKATYDTLSKAYMRYLSDYNLLNKNYAQFLTVAHQLYNLFFQHHAAAAGRVIISPDGHYFPFEALVTTPSGNPNYFFTDHATSYTYSARYLLNNFSFAETKSAGAFLGVAPVQYASTLSMPALPGSDVSLQHIGSNFTSEQLLMQNKATRNNFMQLFSQYKIIQLYTHAAGSSVNNEPVIYFADSLLYLSDLITATKPVTQLIILSACETGKGQLHSGEGVFSFNREFAALGIPSSLINLWMVNSQATYDLTERFHKYLAEGLPPDVALQKARIDYLKTASRENTLPYFWAATLVSGTTNPVQLDEPFTWVQYAAIVMASVLAALGGWLFLRRNKNKRSSTSI